MALPLSKARRELDRAYEAQYLIDHQYTREEREGIQDAYREALRKTKDTDRVFREAQQRLEDALAAKEEARDAAEVHEYWMKRAILNSADEG